MRIDRTIRRFRRLAQIEGCRCRGGCANRLSFRGPWHKGLYNCRTPRQTRPLQLLRSLFVVFSICVNLSHLRIQKIASKPLTSGKLFELDLEVHHILLAGAVSGCAGIEAQATGLIKIPLGLLAV